MAELNDLYKQTGLLVNQNKTEILVLGDVLPEDIPFNVVEQTTVLGVKIFSNCEDNTGERQMEAQVEKMKRVCREWTQRDLSLSGRVLVANMLLASLFVYLMSIFSFQGREILHAIQKILFEFVGKAKRNKIQSRVLTALRGDGGFGLTYVPAKDRALKLTWVKLAREDSLLYSCLTRSIPQWCHEFALELNLHSRHVTFLVDGRSGFWVEVLCVWYQTQFEEGSALESHEIAQQILWFNSNILDGFKQPFQSRSLARKGVTHMYHIWNFEQKCFKSFEGMQADHGINARDWLVLLAVQRGVTKHWQGALASLSSIADMWTTCESEGLRERSELLQMPHLTRWGYGKLQTRAEVQQGNTQKWNSRADTAILCATLVNSWVRVNNLTLSVRIRDFHKKLLCWALFLNNRLAPMGLVDSPYCSFCREAPETFVHWLEKCEVVTQFLSEVKDWMLERSDVVVWETSCVLLNAVGLNERDPSNVIVLFAKYFVYISRQKPERLKLEVFLDWLERCQKDEAMVARKNDKFHVHVRKWQRYLFVQKDQ